MHRNWQGLIRPERLDVLTLTPTYGRFLAQPLERGYGMTLGHGMREILLKRLAGAALVGYRVLGKGLSDAWVSDLILSLKQVAIAGETPAAATLQAVGPGRIRAGQIKGANLRVLNPEIELGTLTEGQELRLELQAETGYGYAPAERNVTLCGDGFTALDAMFAPVRSVKLEVAGARVGRMVDYDKLALEVWTTGALSPMAALTAAAQLFSQQLAGFLNFDDDLLPKAAAPAKVAAPVPEFEVVPGALLTQPVEIMDLSVRAMNCLTFIGVRSIGDLVSLDVQQLMKIRGFGVKSLTEIEEALDQRGLQLGARREA